MQLHVRVQSANAASGKDEELARSLLEEVDAIPMVSADWEAGEPAPPGSKAIGVGVAELILGLGAAGALIPTLVNALRDWLVRQPPATTLRIREGDFEFEWSGTTPPAQVEQLLVRLTERSQA